MAGSKKRAGFTQDELSSLDKMSLDDLDKLITSVRGLESNKQGSAGAPGVTGSRKTLEPQIPIEQQAEQAQNNFKRDSLNILPDAPDSIESIARRNFDQGTLELLPSWADGSMPEKAIPKAVDGATWNRVKPSY